MNIDALYDGLRELRVSLEQQPTAMRRTIKAISACFELEEFLACEIARDVKPNE